MSLTKNEIEILKSHVNDIQEYGYKSYYFEQNGTLIRVSDHIPNEFNFRQFSPDVERIFLILVETEDNEITDSEAEDAIKEIERKSEAEADYMIIDNEAIVTGDDIKTFYGMF